MVDVQRAENHDIEGWLELAREVEPLFGPMAEKSDFRRALQRAIDGGRAFCIRGADHAGVAAVAPLCGGVIVDLESNEVAWLAVARRARGRGYGRALLARALQALNQDAPISVQTFAASVPEGCPARRLYAAFGFRTVRPAGANPAGVPTVVMVRKPQEKDNKPV